MFSERELKRLPHIRKRSGIPGPAAQPDLVIQADVKAFVQRLVGYDGNLTFETGDEATFEQFASAFRFPNGS